MRRNIKAGIYCIENITNNKKYIGQSQNIEDRWCKHKNDLRHGQHNNDHLQNAWNKYGEENFRFFVVEYCEVTELDDKENYYINFYKTLNRDQGYNLKSGGQNKGIKVSDYVRKKQSLAQKQVYQNNDNLIEKRKVDALNQWAKPEIKQKIMGENNGMYGKHHTEESRKKISEKKKGSMSQFRNTTPVFCIELNQSFKDAITACIELNINKSNTGSLLAVCRGKRKTCGGYHWKFLLENNI